MLDGMKRKIAASVLVSFLKSLRDSKDTRTTIVGLVVGALLAIPGLDIEKLISGDPMQFAKVASGLGIWAIGVMATKENADGKATLVGTLSGTLYACQGSVDAIITGLVIAALGYFTNKPVAKKD